MRPSRRFWLPAVTAVLGALLAGASPHASAPAQDLGTWRFLGPDNLGEQVDVRSFAPSSYNYVLAVINDDVVRLTEGSTVGEIVLPGSVTMGSEVAIYPNARPTVVADSSTGFAYVSARNRLWRSTNSGETFMEMPGYPTDAGFVRVEAVRDGVLYAVGLSRLYRSLQAQNPSIHWELVHELVRPDQFSAEYFTNALARFAPGGNSVLHILTQSDSIGHNCCPTHLYAVEGANASPTVTPVRSSLTRFHSLLFAAASADGRMGYRADQFGNSDLAMYRTSDGGTSSSGTWTQVTGPDQAVQALTVHPRNPDWVFADGRSGAIRQSTDGGLTWTTNSLPAVTQGRMEWRRSTLLVRANGIWALDVPGRPTTSIDSPANGATLTQPFRISGWAADAASGYGTGVDRLQVYAYPNPGSNTSPIFLGAGTYGEARPDVGIALGDSRFIPSGFSLTVRNLTPGPYQFLVYQRSTFTEKFTAVSFTANVLAMGAGHPFGQVDTPQQFATDVTGAIGITGWAVDDGGISNVAVYRNCLPFDVAANCVLVDGSNVLPLGLASRVQGARPDVAAAFSDYPGVHSAGWGFQVLSNMLPNVPAELLFGGQGPISFYAYATDAGGRRTLLGRTTTDHSPTTVQLNNEAIGLPFGTIDTPRHGEVVSGQVANFGWVLTSDSDTAANGSDILIPLDGSTVIVYIDDIPAGPVTFNQCRGTVGNPVPPAAFCNDDVASVFGHLSPMAVFSPRSANPTRFRNLDAGRGVIGFFNINTLTLADGLHTLAWSARDSSGRLEGIGSRNFIVSNSGARSPR